MSQKRALPTPRPEGMANILDATMRLLQERSPGDISLRDVATEAGHDVRLAIRVFNYMQMHHPEVVEQVRNYAALDLARQRLLTYRGLSEDQASLATRRLAVLMMGIAVFSEFVNLTDDEIIAMVQDELKTTIGATMPDNPNRA